jgi:hypothetical protein
MKLFVQSTIQTTGLTLLNTAMTGDLPFNRQVDLFLAKPVCHELYDDDISGDEDGDIFAPSREQVFCKLLGYTSTSSATLPWSCLLD